MDQQAKPEYDFGDIVYLVTDENQLKRIVTGYTIRNTQITYYLSCGTIETIHYSNEISEDKNWTP